MSFYLFKSGSQITAQHIPNAIQLQTMQTDLDVKQKNCKTLYYKQTPKNDTALLAKAIRY